MVRYLSPENEKAKKIYLTAAILLYPITTFYKILSKQNSQSFPRPIIIKHFMVVQ